MTYQYIEHIDSPNDLKKLPVEALPQVCAELRDFILQELSHNPGHLASSLGAIELTVALHYVYDSPNDKLVWDVGHQAYAHKILTGRREKFHTNRQFKGLAPFPTPTESEHDAFVAGHASNSISVALGMDIAHNLQHSSQHTVAIIGDGAMTGGLAFEGLNNASMDKNNMLIILNDNNMAINALQGGFSQYLLDLSTSKKYNKFRWIVYSTLNKLGLISEQKKNQVLRFNNYLKSILSKQPSNIFQGLSIRYFGPTDGHDVIKLVKILAEIKNYTGPKVLHVITQKGKGYAPAEKEPTIWHAPGEFNLETGERKASKKVALWQEIFGDTLVELLQTDEKVVGITPAMPSGCGMDKAIEQFPNRVFDVGIAEGHAITFSGGLAKEGLKPFCNIYSTFLQRSYDNIVHDVALLDLPVTICIDRAGIVGNDGATHQGLLDLAYLRPIPNIRIFAPMYAEDLQEILHFARTFEHPLAIRYPRGMAHYCEKQLPKMEYGKGICLREGEKGAILSLGAIGNNVEKALETLPNIAHYNMRWLKPMDEHLLEEIRKKFQKIITIEDGMVEGGFGSAVVEYFADHHEPISVLRLGIKNQFVEHGNPDELYHLLGLDAEGITQSVRHFFDL